MASAMIEADRQRIDARLADIRSRLNELAELWEFACTTDAHYRMVEAEREALKMEEEKLREIRADL